MRDIIKTYRLFIILFIFVIGVGLQGCTDNDDDNDDDNGETPLSVEDLQGIYKLDEGLSSNDPDNLLEFYPFSEILQINEDVITFTFNPVYEATYELTGDNISITYRGELEQARVEFQDNGNTLNVITEEITFVFNRSDRMGTSNEMTVENLEGVYELDVGDSDIVGGSLFIEGNGLSVSLTVVHNTILELINDLIIFQGMYGELFIFGFKSLPDTGALIFTDEENNQFIYNRNNPEDGLPIENPEEANGDSDEEDDG